ncbi:MAG: UbiX family flavin prenyltransferase [Planctomycetota bacterium]
MREYVVGVTGASGVILARRLVGLLLESGAKVHLCASRAAKLVVHEELPPREPGQKGFFGFEHEHLTEWAERDFNAPFASGSAPIAGMAVIPCTMSTVGSIAHGISDNLLKRAAEVMLKERRTLVVVPREAPLSDIHLENMLRISKAGATVIPPVLTFYQSPGDSVQEQVDFVVSRVLDHLGVDNALFRRWSTND